jgi:hypothetical protein
LSECIDESQCSVINGGTVKDRLELLKELTTPDAALRAPHDSSESCLAQPESASPGEQACVSEKKPSCVPEKEPSWVPQTETR